VDVRTYIHDMQLTQKVSRPSQGIWSPFDAAAEQTIHDDFDRLWRTNFLAKLSIEISDYTFSNGVVGKIVVYNMAERPRVKIVDFVGSKPIATSKLDARLKKEHVELRLDTFLDEATIRKVETIVRAMMVEKGFQNAVVTSQIQPLGSPTLVRRRFHIDEGHQRANADRQSAARCPPISVGRPRA
jgi:outer membrane protein assembly factor BamA